MTPPPLPPPLPPSPVVPESTTMKWLLIVAASLTALVLGLLTLGLLGLSTGPTGLLAGMVMAVLPLPIYLLLALWIDRLEKEPVWMLATAFVWGATAAVFFAFILNTGFEIVATGVIGAHADMATTVLSAPFVEELAKGFALLIFYLWKRDEFDNVLDGIIYAAMTGLGFAMTENILYYGRALATEGLGSSIVVFVLRGVVSPFAHPLFTSMTGIGLGVARLARRGSPLKFFAPVIGLGMAMFLHFLWNFSASFGAMFFVAYVLIMVPAFLGLITLVIVSLRKEGKIIREHLMPELRSGLLSDRDYAELSTVRGRMGGVWRAFGSGGWKQWRARVRLHEVASELAFHRWRTARGIFPRKQTPAAREAAYLAQLHAVGRQFGWTPVELAVSTSMTPPPLLVAPAAVKVAPAPRSGGFGGVVIAFGSIGCLGAIAACVVVLAVLYAIGASVGDSVPVVQAEETIEQLALDELLQEGVGGFELESTSSVDAETLAIMGALDGLRGDYAWEMSLVVLRYRSPEAAARAVEPIRVAQFAESAGWEVAARSRAKIGHRVVTVQTKANQMAALYNYGSLVMIFSGDATSMAEFEAPEEILSRQLAGEATPAH